MNLFKLSDYYSAVSIQMKKIKLSLQLHDYMYFQMLDKLWNDTSFWNKLTIIITVIWQSLAW